MIWVGTSGWQYRDWRDRFYPHGLPQREWLAHYATAFETVELNNSFYRLPDANAFAHWHAQTPVGFQFAVKASRYLTHILRLAEPAEPVRRLLSRARRLDGALGPVLLQLPPTLAVDLHRLDRALYEFPDALRVAVELRHQSWWIDAVRRLLEKHGAAQVWADRRSRPTTPLWVTTDWGYVRLHEGRAKPAPRYGAKALAAWLRRVADAFPALDRQDVYVYFNNDSGGAAVVDATAFGRQAERLGLPVSRHGSASGAA